MRDQISQDVRRTPPYKAVPGVSLRKLRQLTLCFHGRHKWEPRVEYRGHFPRIELLYCTRCLSTAEGTERPWSPQGHPGTDDDATEGQV